MLMCFFQDFSLKGFQISDSIVQMLELRFCVKLKVRSWGSLDPKTNQTSETQ